MNSQVPLILHSRTLLKLMAPWNKCYYHPAPLTRKKAQPPTGPQRCRQRRAPDYTPVDQTVDIAGQAVQSPVSSLSPSETSAFLGSTSYISVFKEPRHGCPAELAGRFTPSSSAGETIKVARPARLVSVVDFHYDMISCYYHRGRFTIVPAPLVLTPLK
ncbi:uncharacterized protein ATNIH1004_010835 [Aspergillus tanneri]|uniref:Uncharacterized protein n=1 Tax=Aspergillus tanneri TaxID=1220188 RepID=A0A5M9M8H4_9EURO|nr:uncharacterized protein ATNIH1004_010835 [Aspergillus tanneri]KAA8641896.1 hypothetical protein ATNIH1004_010835 [Aspergillus tanneri]